MSDGVALPAIALLAAGLIALALVWPQGQGARSPAPFGHPLAALVQAPPIAGKTPLELRGPEGAEKAVGAAERNVRRRLHHHR
jgi:hypothetical protein